MRQRRWIGAGLAAVALSFALAGPARADDSTSVSAVGPSSGVEVHCPEGMHADSATVTNPDGTPLAPDQRIERTAIDGGTGVAAWIAPYDHSPPPPTTIMLTVVCVC